MPPGPGRRLDARDLHARGGAGDHAKGHRLARLRASHATRESGFLHARQLRQRRRGEIGVTPPAGCGSRRGHDRGQRRCLGDDGPRWHGRAVEREGDHEGDSEEQKGEGKEMSSVHCVGVRKSAQSVQ